MVFNSLAYLAFFPLFVGVYFLIPPQYRWIAVLIGSYFFYMSWKPVYGLLLFSTTLLDWLLALWMSRAKTVAARTAILTASLTANLGVLFFFKYFNFISGSLWDLFNLHGAPLFFQILLPIGISFYTFQSIAYMVDVYRTALLPEKNFGRYAAFVSFFPHLVSGPILRPANIIPQLHEEKKWNNENMATGLYLIATGLIKKVIIADRLSFFVNTVYGSPGSFSGATLVLATYFFAFQIYCDFAGYTDIAIGSARILGYHIPDNFRQPYFSQNIQEFWRRWHISLSSWLRDYLYIPLGGNRQGRRATYRNLMVTMLLGGLWHGAAWTFVIWGGLHGLWLSLSKYFDVAGNRRAFLLTLPGALHRLLRIIVTFNLVCITWIFFRAASLAQAVRILKTIVYNFGTVQFAVLTPAKLVLYIGMIAAVVLFDYLEQQKRILRWVVEARWYYQWALALGVIFLVIFLGVESGPQFIYFQF